MPTIHAADTGVYEQQLTADTPTSVTIESRGATVTASVQVMVHTATAPVYIRTGTDITPRDPQAQIIAPGTWADIAGLPTGQDVTISLTSDADATVSVYRA